MRIKCEDIYVGDIMLCTHSGCDVEIETAGSITTHGGFIEKSELYKEGATLIKVDEEQYVVANDLELPLIVLKKRGLKYKKNILDACILKTSPEEDGRLFVTNIEPYYLENDGKVKVKKMKTKSLIS